MNSNHNLFTLREAPLFHLVLSSCPLTTSCHHLKQIGHHQEPCLLITTHPSSYPQWSNWDHLHFDSKCFKNKSGCKLCSCNWVFIHSLGNFLPDIGAEKWVVRTCSWCRVAFWVNRGTDLHEGGTRLLQPEICFGQNWSKGTGELGVDTLVFFSQTGNSAVNSVERRRRGSNDGEGKGKNRQTDTKRSLCQSHCSAIEDNEH